MLYAPVQRYVREEGFVMKWDLAYMKLIALTVLYISLGFLALAFLAELEMINETVQLLGSLMVLVVFWRRQYLKNRAHPQSERLVAKTELVREQNREQAALAKRAQNKQQELEEALNTQSHSQDEHSKL